MSREQAPTTFMKVKSGLFPSNDAAHELLKTLTPYKPVNVKVQSYRNIDRLRAYWAMLRDCVDATGCAPTAEVLHIAVKEGCGFVEGVILKDGSVKRVVSSVAFAKMDEPEFIKFMQAAQEWLASEIGWGGN